MKYLLLHFSASQIANQSQRSHRFRLNPFFSLYQQNIIGHRWARKLDVLAQGRFCFRSDPIRPKKVPQNLGVLLKKVRDIICEKKLRKKKNNANKKFLIDKKIFCAKLIKSNSCSGYFLSPKVVPLKKFFIRVGAPEVKYLLLLLLNRHWSRDQKSKRAKKYSTDDFHSGEDHSFHSFE